MDRHRRLIQAISLLLCVVFVLGAGFSLPGLKEARQIDGYSAVADDEAVSPEIALFTAALGSFRGLLINIMWYQLFEMQQKGQYYQVNTLAQTITRMNPRFAKVWSYHAWNMAYNISVTCHTPDERWEWVNKGVRLLREEGIPNNPKDVGLYRELNWIFFHKMGGFTDDSHWYYKQRLAREIERFNGDPFTDTGVQVINDRIREKRREAAADERTFPFAKVAVTERFRYIAEQPDTLEELIALNSNVEKTIAELEKIGYKPDFEFLLDIGTIQMYAGSIDGMLFGPEIDDMPHDFSRKLFAGLSTMDKSVKPGLEAVIAFLRRRYWIDQYKMDPDRMLAMMDDYGPIDWRVPAGHGAYWADIGIELGQDSQYNQTYDELNTTRMRLYCFQELTKGGRIFYDPYTDSIDVMPEPAFIEAYDKAWQVAIERAETGEMSGAADHAQGNVQNFAQGHQNFLNMCTTYQYLYGDVSEARRLFNRAAELYDKPGDRFAYQYSLPLEEFVVQQLGINNVDFRNNNQFIDAMIQRGIRQGLMVGRTDTFVRFLNIARAKFEITEEKSEQKEVWDRERIAYGSFDDAVTSKYISFMRQQDLPITVRARAWFYTPLPIQEAVFLELQPIVFPQAIAAGYDPVRAFRPPPSLKEELARRAKERAASASEIDAELDPSKVPEGLRGVEIKR